MVARKSSACSRFEKEKDMPELSLGEYGTRIAQQIENSNIEEAIAHCRHILSRYPRYLPAYRLLAHACLEKGDFAHAMHFFQCVLSADPENADAWMNLAMLSDDLGELEQATWLMERALEVQPGNARIRDQLRQLYSRRDGIERTRIKLTPSALARLYADGGFYRRAVEELEKLLKSTPDLPPLHIAHLEVALAESFWHREGMAPMADRICQSLTEKLPNCLQANLIMGHIRWSAGIEEEAEAYLQVIRALDPEGRFAYEMLSDQSPIPLTEIQIPYLDYEAQAVPAEQAQVAEPEGEDVSWLDHIVETTEAADGLAPALEGETEAPDWLKEWPPEELSASVSRVEETRGESTALVSDVHFVEESEPMAPDWLLDLEGQRIVEPTWEGAEEISEGEVPAWLAEATVERASEAEIPDWLRELDTEAGVEEPISMVEEEIELAAQIETPAEAMSEEELPDWLRDLSTEAAIGEPTPAFEKEAELLTQIETPAEAVSEEEFPDWLRELQPEEFEEPVSTVTEEPEAAALIKEAAVEPVSEEELPDWLQELRAEGAVEEPAPALEEEAELLRQIETPAGVVYEQEFPEWLRELQPEKFEEPVSTVTEETEAAALTREAAVEPVSEEELPDWVQELRAEGAVEEPVSALEEEAELLRQIETPAGVVYEEELPEWLRELQSEEFEEPVSTVTEETEAAALVREAAVEPVSEEEFPDWPQELRAEGAAEEPVSALEEEAELLTQIETPAEVVSEKEFPEWLRELQPEEFEEPVSTVTEETEAAALVKEAAVEPVSDEELPDWPRELHAEGAAEEPVSALEEGAELLRQIETPAGVVYEEEFHEWLRELQPEEFEEPVSTVTAEIEEGAIEELTGASEGVAAPAEVEMLPPVERMPGWLAELDAETGGQVTAPSTEYEPDIVPEMVTAPGAPEMPPPIPGMPDWLTELEAEISGQTRVSTTEEELAPTSETVATPDVSKEIISPVVETEPTAAPETITAPPAAEALPLAQETPEWLAELEVEMGSQESPSAGEEELVEGLIVELAVSETTPAWLAELDQEATLVDLQAELAMLETDLEEKPEWLVELEKERVSTVTVEEMPEWLEQLHAPETGRIVETEPGTQALEPPSVEEMDSLRELEELEAPEPAQIQEEPTTLDLGIPAGEEHPPSELPEAVLGEVAQPDIERAATEAEILEGEAGIQRYQAQLVSAPGDHETRLSLARAYLRAGNLDDSARGYEQLAKVPALTEALIHDLEKAVANHPEHHALQRVLGDAYMRAGKLNNALDAYKQALTKLTRR